MNTIFPITDIFKLAEALVNMNNSERTILQSTLLTRYGFVMNLTDITNYNEDDEH